MRGQLSSVFNNPNDTLVTKFLKKRVTTLFSSKLNKPHFVAYDILYSPNKYLDKAKKQGIIILLWTLRNTIDYEKTKNYADNYIFDTIVL